MFQRSENMEDLFDGFSEDITKWEIVREMIDLDLEDEIRNQSRRADPSIQLLPRQDVTLYGMIPKMEQKIYTKCKECGLVFNRRDILLHKTCSGKMHVSSTTQSLKKKVKSKGSSSKKPHSSLPPPPLFKKPPSPLTGTSSAAVVESKSPLSKISSKTPKISTVSSNSSTHTVTTTSTKSETRVSSSSSHSSKSSSVHSPKSPSKSVSNSAHSPKSSSKTTTSTETTASSSVSSSSSSSSSSRHKKSRKSNNNTKITKEFDPDVHCGVMEGSRGPCTRSITCSNHRIQLRKLVPGRSKDIHQLIAERKAAKEKELKHGSSSSSYMSPNGEEKDMFCQNTSYVPIVATIVSTINSSSTTTYVPIMPKTSTSPTIRPNTSMLTAKQLNMTDAESKSTKALDGGYLTSVHNNSQDGTIGSVPLVYMPLSPISMVSQELNMSDGENKSSPSLDGSYLESVHNGSQDSAMGTVPVVYMPLSPISIVSQKGVDENKPAKTSDGNYRTSNSQDNAIGTVPVVHMPMNPVSVVSPVQFVQIGKKMICLESQQSAMSRPLSSKQSLFLSFPNQQLNMKMNDFFGKSESPQSNPPATSNQSIFLTIPNQQLNMEVYEIHPKPVSVPSYGAKKVGGAVVLSNQRVVCQRNDILTAMKAKQDTVNNAQGYRAISLFNHTNTPHRPNILKVKSASRVNCKRPAVDKLNSVSDNKQLRLSPNVNGFILHSDISETADAPQSNNCIQEKIALLNMK
ncbi:hypothetical protein NQ315_010195 [Exocentrus adspersus]|uniref:SCA7 domain-containing protein n=1 Tax=Exocentrus adspersus TaxID=1586481 RepID=A0AAV8WBK2_9CUCU|nr:hypothetical protein NQ315_010195 [Exocentrus adspersus]